MSVAADDMELGFEHGRNQKYERETRAFFLKDKGKRCGEKIWFEDTLVFWYFLLKC